MPNLKSGKIAENMIVNSQQWATMHVLTPGMFKYPEKLDYNVVQGVDTMAVWIGETPQILDDWRPYDPNNPKSQHAKGMAIDTAWSADPAVVLEAAKKVRLLGGIGIYVNEKEYTSFHTDSRPLKQDGSHYTWGGLITRRYDTQQQKPVKKIEYVGLGLVLDLVKKNINTAGVLVLLILGGAIWLLAKN